MGDDRNKNHFSKPLIVVCCSTLACSKMAARKVGPAPASTLHMQVTTTPEVSSCRGPPASHHDASRRALVSTFQGKETPPA